LNDYRYEVKRDMNRKHRQKAWWVILASLVLGVVALSVAVCPLSDAGSVIQTPTATEKNPALDTGEGSTSSQGWDWEWQEDQDPSRVGRPTYLR